MKSSLKAIAGAIWISGAVVALCESPAQAAQLTEQAKLLERVKIEELLVRSGRAFDKHDVDAWIATFTPDGEWDTQYVTCKGPEALRAYLTKGFNCIGVPGGAAVPGAPPPPYSARRGGASAGAATETAGRASGTDGASPGSPAAVPAAAATGDAGRSASTGNTATSEHFVSSPLYEFIDANTVHYTAYWMTVSGAGETVGGRIASVGSYDDTIVKKDGKWLIQKRQLKH